MQKFSTPTPFFPSLYLFGGGLVPVPHTPWCFSALAKAHLVPISLGFQKTPSWKPIPNAVSSMECFLMS